MAMFSAQSLKSSWLDSRTSRWLWGLGALSMVVIGLGLLVLLTQATGRPLDPTVFEAHLRRRYLG